MTRHLLLRLPLVRSSAAARGLNQGGVWYVAGKRTSLYLTDDRAEALMARGINLLECLDRGLACNGRCSSPAARLRGEVTQAQRGTTSTGTTRRGAVGTAERRMAAAEGRPLDHLGEPCAHPKARIMRGLCMACGEAVSNGKQAASS